MQRTTWSKILMAVAGIVSMAAVPVHGRGATQAAIDAWVGQYDVEYNYGTGNLTLEETYVDTADQPIHTVAGTLELRKGSVVKLTCSTRGFQVRTDRIVLEGDCQGGRTERYYFYLAKAPGAFHGYYHSHRLGGTTESGFLGPKRHFENKPYLTAIWGTGGPPPPQSGSGGQPACPYVYAFDPEAGAFVQQGEILRHLVGKESEALDTLTLPRHLVRNGKLVLSVREEKDEVSSIDYLAIRVGERIILPNVSGDVLHRLASRDGSYLTMWTGDQLQLTFDVGPLREGERIELLSAGFYTHEPSRGSK